MKKRVIFFDVDGVLNCDTTVRTIHRFYDFVDTRKVIRLRELVRAVDADLVMCSSWRYGVLPDASWEEINTYNQLRQEFLKQGIQWADVTPWIRGAKRWKEINAFLVEHPEIEEWIVIDDTWEDLRPILDHCIITTMKYGFNKAKLEEVIALFDKIKENKNV